VLLIDLDPQANLTQSLGLTNQERTIYGALKETIKFRAGNDIED
jgi:chromosome partitioning protein